MTDGLDEMGEGYWIREAFAHYGRAAYAASCVETGPVIALMT